MPSEGLKAHRHLTSAVPGSHEQRNSRALPLVAKANGHTTPGTGTQMAPVSGWDRVHSVTPHSRNQVCRSECALLESQLTGPVAAGFLPCGALVDQSLRCYTTASLPDPGTGTQDQGLQTPMLHRDTLTTPMRRVVRAWRSRRRPCSAIHRDPISARRCQLPARVWRHDEPL